MKNSVHTLHHPPFSGHVETLADVRFLTCRDLPALLQLEEEKWNNEQAAAASTMLARIATHPDLSIGGFCADTGQLLTSLFLKPVTPDFWSHVQTWQDCTRLHSPQVTDSLFGISMSSRSKTGVDACLKFLHIHASLNGWRHIYLGSPIPGLQDWRQGNPHEGIEAYVRRKRNGLPLDPQLKYYHQHGFRDIVCIKPDYFPHTRSLNHGVMLRGFPL